MEYTLKKQAEEGQSVYESLIEMSGLSYTVSISSLLNHLESTQRIVKEQSVQLKLNEALIEKAYEELPILKEIPEDKLNLALSCIGKIMANRETVELLNEAEKSIDEYKTHLEKIQEATGIECAQTKNPFEVTPIDTTGQPEHSDPSGDEIVKE